MPSASISLKAENAEHRHCANLWPCVLAILTLGTDNPILQTTAWACPIPGMPTATCVALLAGGKVQVVADRTRPIVRVAVHPIAPEAGGKSVVAAIPAIVVTLSPMLYKTTP